MKELFKITPDKNRSIMIGSMSLLAASILLGGWVTLYSEPVTIVTAVGFLILGWVQYYKGFPRKLMIILTALSAVAVICILVLLYL